jgi:predicted dehydrogenase
MVAIDNNVGIAVVGCGYWGVNYVRVFTELAGAQVVAICDERRERLEEVGQRFPGPALVTSLDELLGRKEVKAVIICTGATTHYEVARRCLNAGKHVLVEKPMATTVQDAQALDQLANAQGRVLMVGHTFLYHSAVRKIKEYIERKDVGRIYYLYARRTNLGPIRRDVNALWDLAPHDLSIFNYLLDSKPVWVSAVGARVLNNGHEDVGFVSLGYPNGVVGNIHVSWADPNKVRELVVVSDSKRIVFDDMNMTERVKVYEKGVAPAAPEAATYGEFHLQLRDGDIVSPRVDASEPLKNQCNHFLTCVTQQCHPLTNGEAGLQVVEALAAIDRSVAQQGAPVFLSQNVAATLSGRKASPYQAKGEAHGSHNFRPAHTLC